MNSDRKIGNILEAINDAAGHPILIFPAGRKDVSDAYGAPFHLVPHAARVVAVGKHNRLSFGLVAYLSETGNIIVALAGPAVAPNHRRNAR